MSILPTCLNKELFELFKYQFIESEASGFHLKAWEGKKDQNLNFSPSWDHIRKGPNTQKELKLYFETLKFGSRGRGRGLALHQRDFAWP